MVGAAGIGISVMVFSGDPPGFLSPGIPAQPLAQQPPPDPPAASNAVSGPTSAPADLSVTSRVIEAQSATGRQPDGDPEIQSSQEQPGVESDSQPSPTPPISNAAEGAPSAAAQPPEAPQLSLAREPDNSKLGPGSAETAPSDPKVPAASPTPPPNLNSTKQIEADLSELRQLLPRDQIEPIYEPRFVSAGQSSLKSDELVIGVEINGESKAYPVGPLNAREMVNDTVGGVPILVSW